MNDKRTDYEHSTTLNDEHFENCLTVAVEFLRSNGSIRNRELREVAGIGYDQAIGFFNRATVEKRLVRRGIGSGTHYVLHDT